MLISLIYSFDFAAEKMLSIFSQNNPYPISKSSSLATWFDLNHKAPTSFHITTPKGDIKCSIMNLKRTKLDSISELGFACVDWFRSNIGKVSLKCVNCDNFFVLFCNDLDIAEELQNYISGKFPDDEKIQLSKCCNIIQIENQKINNICEK